MEDIDVFRTTSTRTAPDPARIAEFAAHINQSKNPVLVYGGDIARSDGWDEGIALAETVNAPVWNGPFSERISFPENHPLFKDALPAAIGPLSKALQGHDLVVVIGAPVFRYYPWVAGDYLPTGATLLQITDSPYEAAKAVVGDSLVSDSKLAMIELSKLITPRNSQPQPTTKPTSTPEILEDIKYPLTAKQLFAVLSVHVPEDYILVQESPSNIPELSRSRLGTICKPDSYYTMGSGGLGWDMPAAVGLAFAEKWSGRNRPVIVIMGDGSFQYSPQAIWTAVQHGLHITIVVPKNEEYGILKSFALLEETPNVPGLDLPGIDIVSLAKGYGAKAHFADKAEDIQDLFKKALGNNGVTVIEVPIDKHIHALLDD
ncbi:MAG: hypothetical protein BA863_17150 [Desulfovibrio sp. S3730MH75]|nr:MAG: hypothetical protein BA863_17150 [Desulfovibrio sp. S3730MH75]